MHSIHTLAIKLSTIYTLRASSPLFGVNISGCLFYHHGHSTGDPRTAEVSYGCLQSAFMRHGSLARCVDFERLNFCEYQCYTYYVLFCMHSIHSVLRDVELTF